MKVNGDIDFFIGVEYCILFEVCGCIFIGCFG